MIKSISKVGMFFCVQKNAQIQRLQSKINNNFEKK